jgi:hypothetical protein
LFLRIALLREGESPVLPSEEREEEGGGGGGEEAVGLLFKGNKVLFGYNFRYPKISSIGSCSTNYNIHMLIYQLDFIHSKEYQGIPLDFKE